MYDWNQFLIDAAITDNVMILQACLKKSPAHVYAVRDENGGTLAQIAVRGGYTNFLRELLKSGFDANTVGSHNNTALHTAAYIGNLECLKLLVQYGADVNCLNVDLTTPLIAASMNKQAACVKELLALGAKPDLKNKFGNTAVIQAALMGDVESLRHLHAAKANLNFKDDVDLTALIYLVGSNNIQAVIFLCKVADANLANKAGVSPLMVALNNNYNECALALIEAGADVNLPEKDGFTPLHFAALKRNSTMVYYLVKQKALVNAKNKNDYTPLMLAAEYGDHSSLRILIQAGAKTRVVSKGKQTPLTLAAKVGSVECLELLLWHKHNLEARESNGDTALIIAVKNRRIKFAERLIAAGAKTNITDGNGKSLLQLAIENGLNSFPLENVKLETRDKDGDTPLILAVKKGRLKFAERLITAGAKTDITDGKGTSLLKLTIEKGLSSLAVKLIKAGYDLPEKSTCTLFGLKLSRDRKKLVPQSQMTRRHFIGALNDTLFVAVHQKDLKTVQAALQSGADPTVQCFQKSVSALGLALHLDEKESIELIMSHLSRRKTSYDDVDNVKYYKAKASLQVDDYYDITAQAVANTCTSKKMDAPLLQHELARRLKKGRFIRAEIRKMLYERTKDKAFMESGDCFDLELKLDAKLVNAIREKGVDLDLPDIDKNLVSQREILQITQELVVMCLLQQQPSLSLDADPLYGVRIDVKLTESLHDTLVGSVLIETDRIMKDYIHNSIYVPRASRLPNNATWQKQLNTDSVDQSQLTLHPIDNINAVQELYSRWGGIDLRSIPGVRPMQARIEMQKAEQELGGKVQDFYCLYNDNSMGSISYNGNVITLSTGIKAITHGKITRPDGKIEDYYNETLSIAKHLTDVLPKIPVTAKQFALLKAIYTLMPAVQIMVMTNRIPDFGKLLRPDYYETEKSQLPVLLRYPVFPEGYIPTLDEAEKKIADSLKDPFVNPFAFAVCGGTAYDPEFAMRERKEALERSREINQASGYAMYSAIADQLASPSYGKADEWQWTTLNKGDQLLGNTTPDKGASPFFTSPDTYMNTGWLSDSYADATQIAPHAEKGLRDSVNLYEATRDGIRVPAAICSANPQHGEGGAKEYYVLNYATELKVVRTLNLLK